LSRHRKSCAGPHKCRALGHGLFGLFVKPSLHTGDDGQVMGEELRHLHTDEQLTQTHRWRKQAAI